MRAERRKVPTAGSLAMLALLGSAAFYRITLSTRSLGGYDWVYHFHYYDWTRISLTTYRALPLYMADALHTPHFLANPQSPILGPLVWLLFLVPTSTYIKLLIVVYSSAGLLGMYALLRDDGVNPEIALLGGVIFAFNGFFPAHIAVGHHWSFGAWLLPTLVLFFRRAARGDRLAIWAAAAVNALVIFEGGHHPFVWQNFFLALLAGLTCLQTRSVRPARTWLLLVLLTLGLGAVKLLPMIAEFGHYAPDIRIGGLPPAAALHALTARGQSDIMTHPGIAFQYGSGWWEYAFYMGAAPLVLLVAGFLSARRTWPMLLVGLFFLLVSLDLKAVAGPLDPWNLISGLPGWRTQRCPSRFLIVALFAFIAAAGVGLQGLLDGARRRPRLHQTARVALGVLTLFVAVDLHRESRVWQRAGPGEYPASRRHLPVIVLGPSTRGSGALFSEFTPRRFAVEVESAVPADLVMVEEFVESADQWRVEGGEIGAVQGRLAVRVAPGRRKVLFCYTPRFYRAGMALSALTLLAGILTVLVKRAFPDRLESSRT